MYYITDQDEIKLSDFYIEKALKEAKKSTCRKSQRWAVIVNDWEIIWIGYNKVTLEEICNPCIRGSIKDNSRVELCSAFHAEQTAIIDALKKWYNLCWSRMYHIAMKKWEVLKNSWQPSCTICSRMILESGIKEFVLKFENWYWVYSAHELNKLSFEYCVSKFAAIAQ